MTEAETDFKPGWLWRELVKDYKIDKHGVLNSVKRVNALASSVQEGRVRRGSRLPNPNFKG